MSDLDQYLEAEFRRYFPDLTEFFISHDDHSEVIDVTIHTPTVSPWYWSFAIGSDDDWYSFSDSNGTLLTIPLMPEPPSTDNIGGYFAASFPSVIDEFSDEDLETLTSMPTDSVCGAECVRAIDSAKELDDLIRSGHGPHYSRHSNETLAIARVAADLCSLYIRG